MNYHYVYKYIDQSQRVVYVGITNNMPSRVAQHRHDKLGVLDNPTIMYFAVKYRYDAEMLETYLINKYGTGKHFNVLKKDRGNVSFLGDPENLPWTVWDGSVKDMTPFVASPSATVTGVVEKPVYVQRTKYVGKQLSDEQIIQNFYEEREENDRQISEEIDNAIEIVKTLTLMLDSNHPLSKMKKVPDTLISEGIRLHSIRLELLQRLKHFNLQSPTFRDGSVYYELLKEASWNAKEIEEHERKCDRFSIIDEAS